MARMRRRMGRSMRSFLRSRWISSSVRLSFTNRITELTTFEMTVAIATPLTDILSTATKNRFSTTFRMPDIVSATSGTLVSPTLRNIAASKLYSRMTGRPTR